MRRIFLTIFALCLCGQIIIARADTFPLADGASLTGDILSFNDNGITFRQTDSTYTNVMWTKFSQEGLKQLAAKNPKIRPLVEPFIEIPLSERPHKPEVKLQEVTRLERPAPQSLIGALFSSSVGLFALVLIYAANIYAGFEIAFARARPKVLVMGVAAVLPIIGPIIFLAMPMRTEAAPETEPVPTEAEAATFAVAGQVAAAATEEVSVAAGESPIPTPKQPAGQIFKRGQFTFNRRFIETKFAAFVGVASGVEKNQTLLITISSGQFAVDRITNISSSEVHLEVVQGDALQPIVVPFAEIQEMQLQPKSI